ncbi:RagB/SusD family nutrient uptake outer membrane protein [Chitinophaga qingshengii]|uniref:RagB/SusD family nutrient uptake outer membrane protein n=1 Tax=Chitinophaga qingshengii TaxID=1569794 RepID=A0ABR7TF79_9BACT|nr:RagB/SusD family nutrient uptake outer membrane protein [Chitinophaga qingshengii]MBC9928957.1 RagB/SusD family nutrient uptake outer membrane protein [Chitinophaga qingshengii]
MNTLIRYTLCTTLLLGAGTFAGCNKYLDILPESQYTAGTAKTETEFKLAVLGAYGTLRNVYTDYVPENLECHSDDANADNPGNQMAFAQFTLDAAHVDLNYFWQRFFVTINNCNTVLTQIDQANFNEQMKKAIKGEALFIRGFCYFQLGWQFGGVPLIDKTMSVEEVRKVKRSTQDGTLDFAANDLKTAVDLLPEAWGTADLGRATRYAAKGVLAKLHLFRKKYTDARPLLEDILQSGKYQLYPNFKDAFTDANNNGPEHIFQLQHKSGTGMGQGNALIYSYVPQDILSPMFPNGGRSTWPHLSRELYEIYEAGDVRRDITIQKGYRTTSQLLDTASIMFVKFAWGTIPLSKEDYAVNKPILRLADVKLMYAEVLNELGYAAGGEAFKQLNDIRVRAHVNAYTATDLPGQAAFRDALFLERRRELAGEFNRWFDIVRQGADKAVAIMNAHFSRADQGSGRYSMKPYMVVFPIPQYELNTNPDKNVIWQNDGY